MKTLTFKNALLCLALSLMAFFSVRLLCEWVGYDLQERLGNTPTYQILNDEYDQIIDIPAEGLTQEIPLKAGQPFYGIRLKFSTHGDLYKSGMVMLKVRNAKGKVILYTAANHLNIFDETFYGFAAEEPYIAASDETLTAYIYNEVEWDGPLGLWASTGTVDDMTLYQGKVNGKALDATLAVQYVSDYTGTWAVKLAKALELPLSMAAFVAVLLAGLHAPLAALTAVVGLTLGLGFIQVTPALVAPDEYTHLAAAYELAGKIAGLQTTDANGNLLVRECDSPYFATQTGEIGLLAYKQRAQIKQAEYSNTNNSAALSVSTQAVAGQGSGNYLPQAVGIFVARILGKDFYTMLDWGRTGNLLFYIALTAFAVWLAPASLRGIFSCAALLPMALQLAGSLSPDASVIAFAFCYTALCLRLRTGTAPIWKICMLPIFGALVAPAKAVYLPLVLLCLIIPSKNLAANSSAKWLCHGRTVQLITLSLACVLWLLTNISAAFYAVRDINPVLIAGGLIGTVAVFALTLLAYAKMRTSPIKIRYFKIAVVALLVLGVLVAVRMAAVLGRGLSPDELLMTNPNGDSIWTFSLGYVCANLRATAKLLLRTLPEQADLWLRGLLGTTLGEPIVYRIDVSNFLTTGLLLAITATALPVQGQKACLGRRSSRGVGLILLCVLAALLVTALNWTPINYQTLFGMQGRYLLPILPLSLLLVGRCKYITLSRNSAYAAAITVAALNILTQLQGFSLYASYAAQ